MLHHHQLKVPSRQYPAPLLALHLPTEPPLLFYSFFDLSFLPKPYSNRGSVTKTPQRKPCPLHLGELFQNMPTRSISINPNHHSAGARKAFLLLVAYTPSPIKPFKTQLPCSALSQTIG
ncbi:hypothetical protein ABW19_dt0208624 [Dactylella cylindrospora]|nr:hypothetical protein ABW19_dt0208624 [Dactylella cylindrospora]